MHRLRPTAAWKDQSTAWAPGTFNVVFGYANIEEATRRGQTLDCRLSKWRWRCDAACCAIQLMSPTYWTGFRMDFLQIWHLAKWQMLAAAQKRFETVDQRWRVFLFGNLESDLVGSVPYDMSHTKVLLSRSVILQSTHGCRPHWQTTNDDDDDDNEGDKQTLPKCW